MTSVDKLNKAFEILRLANALGKKDKIANLNLVYENIIAQNVRQSDEYSKSLGQAVETFLAFIDDEDQDVYFVAEECLNKTLKTLLDSNLARFPADLYRYLRRNGPERSLRAALTRFAEISHLIKPHKCRIYVEFFIKENLLGKIASRTEEGIQNALLTSMNKICNALCWSMNDSEIKLIIQSFLPNLSNTSSINTYRRVSANCLSFVCLYSRSPLTSYHYLLEELLKLLMPLEDNEDVNKKFTIWGVLQCFRYMIMHLAELDKSSNSSFSGKQSAEPLNTTASNFKSPKKSYILFDRQHLCQIYEVCVYYLNYEDNRITIASLESLQVLFRLTPFRFHEYLTKTCSANESSSSFLRTYFSNSIAYIKQSGSMDSLNTLKPVGSHADEARSGFDEPAGQCTFLNSSGENSNIDYKPVKLIDQRIGSFYDTSSQIPNLYFLRLISYNFLLNKNVDNENEKRKFKSDSEVKVILKSVALDCCASALSLSPHLLFESLFNENVSSKTSLHFYDLIDYVNHEDDKMRTNACLLIGQLINSILIENNGSYDKWLENMLDIYSNIAEQSDIDFLRLESLIYNIIKFLRPESNFNNMTKRLALAALHSFLPTLVKTRRAPLALYILLDLMNLKNSTYNLVKCELLDLFASIDFKTVDYLLEESLHSNLHRNKKNKQTIFENLSETESESEELSNNEEESDKAFDNGNSFSLDRNYLKQIQDKILNEIFIFLLSSEDSKVRIEAARSLTRFVSNMSSYQLSQTRLQNILLSLSEDELKMQGYTQNMLNSSLIDNDFFNLNSVNLNKQEQLSAHLPSNQTPQYSSVLAPTSLLHGGHSAKRQIRYTCSPLHSLSLNSSLTWLSKSILNNNFVQPFYSLIKYWPSNVSTSQTLSNNMNRSIEHNLNYTIQLLITKLLESLDKTQLIGYLESLDFLFQVYEPAIFYASNPSSNQILELINVLLSLLRHPNVSFDLYLHDILLRLIGTLYSSLSWLCMKKMDKIVQEIYFNLNNNTGSSAYSIIQSLLDTLNNALKIQPLFNSQAEIETGLNYSYSFGFNNSNIKAVIDQLFVHTIKMLCVLACVIDETALPSSLTSNLSAGSTAVSAQPTTATSQAQNNPAMSTSAQTSLNTNNINNNASNAPSFLKSQLNTITENKLLSRNNSTASLNSSISSASSSSSSSVNPNSSFLSQKDSPKTQSNYSLPKPNANVYLGNFQNSSHYLKIYETLKVSFSLYKKSSQLGIYDKFNQVLKSTLKLFAQLLECALSVHELGPHLDEILLYLKVLFSIEPSCSVKCVTLCLKSLFGLNLAGLMFEYLQQQINKTTSLNSQLNSNEARPHSNSQVQVSLSGLSSVMSTSLTSIASLTTGTTPSNTFNQLAGANCWSSSNNYSSSKRHKTSLFANIVESKFNQFNKFMQSQSVMSRNEDLNGALLQFNSAGNLLNLGTGIGYDSVEYVATNNSSNASLTSTISSSSIIKNNATVTASNNLNITNNSVQKASSTNAPNTGFSLFSFIKKNKEKSPTTSATASRNSTLSSSIPNSSPTTQLTQQQLIEQHQQKLKQQKTDLKIIGQYIKSFESIVIKSLRQYTLTTSVNLQSKILELLVQLIFLKVDYCLLDSDKVFIDYVLRQFEYLEHSQTGEKSSETDTNLLSKSYLADLYENFDSESALLDPLNPFDSNTMLNKLNFTLSSSNSVSFNQFSSQVFPTISLRQQEHQQNHLIIPKLFDFLILLSHEKKVHLPQQIKQGLPAKSNILTVPEIMQLCDNLIASENSPHTHGIPALRSIVIDLFLNRPNDDSKELDMQHDVIMMTMLRLVHYPQVWPLLTLAITKFKSSNQEKWKKCSRQVCDAFFDSMRASHLKLKFAEFSGNELRSIRRYSSSFIPHINSLKQLIYLMNSLAPQVFRPVDFILSSLFETSKIFFKPLGTLTINELNHSLCIFLFHLNILLNHCIEDLLLTRLYNLVPQIIASYNSEEKLFINASFSFIPFSARKTTHLLSASSTKSGSISTDENELSSLSSSASTTSQADAFESFENALDGDENEFNQNESALFLAQFLLKIYENVFLFIDSQTKFNASMFSQGVGLTSSSSNAFLKDFQLNQQKDLCYSKHLLFNSLMFLLYLVNSGHYNKMSNAISSLVNDKHTTRQFEAEEEFVKYDNTHESNKLSNSESITYQNFDFVSSMFTNKINKVILEKFSKTDPYFASTWQYFLLSCNYQDSDYWLSSFQTSSPKSSNKNASDQFSESSSSANHSLNDEQSNFKISKTKSNNSARKAHIFDLNVLKYSKLPKTKTLNEVLFKNLSLSMYCDYLTSGNQLDNTTGLTMLIINNLVELFELVPCEPSVMDLFSTIHRNAYASNLFIHSLDSNWSQIESKKKPDLLHSCLKTLEGVHLSCSGQLLNLVIDKYFHLPYLSLVCFADHIACQRVEMLQSLPVDELLKQFNEENIKMLTNYFSEEFKYSYRHKRLISLLDQLIKSLNTFDYQESPAKMTTSPSTLDFFVLYSENANKKSENSSSLDKEWFYNMVQSASALLKPKQCALILSNLDCENVLSIFREKSFKLSILKECLLLGAQKSQLILDKLPGLLKNARITNLEQIQSEFMHPLWTSSSNFLFNLLKETGSKVPKPQIVSLDQGSSFRDEFYEQRLGELSKKLDYDSYIAPLTEAINAYLKSIHEYPCLNLHNSEENQTSLLVFSIFQLEIVKYINSQNKNETQITLSGLNKAFSCLFNVLIDQEILVNLCSRTDYSTLVSQVIRNFYSLIQNYFLKQEESLINIPQININYKNYTSDILFNPYTLNLMQKLRALLTSHRSAVNLSSSNNLGSSNESESVNKNSNIHLFLQENQLRDRIPFYLRDLIEKIYISLCRLPILDRFMRIPDSLWKIVGRNFAIEFNQLLKNDSTTLPPLDYLRDPLILKEHLRHILSVGWTSRAQFEYEYVNLLTLLHNISDDYYLPMSTSSARENLTDLEATTASNQINDLPCEEIRERNKSICLVIKALASWLIKSTLAPKSGNALTSLYEQVGRYKMPSYLNTKIGKQYCHVKRIIDCFSRSNQFTKINLSINNNSNLVYMLDPIIISEFNHKHFKELGLQTQNLGNGSNFSNEKTALNNLYQVSTSLSRRDHFNSLFYTNIERMMLVNLPHVSDTYFHFTQISLESLLKFLGRDSHFSSSQTTTNKSANFTETIISNLNNSTVSNVVDEALNSLTNKVAEIFNDETHKTNLDEQIASHASLNANPSPSATIERSFDRNNLDITSVLRTVLDYYESFFKNPSLQLKLDILRSMIYLSNTLFDSKQQYESLSTKLNSNFDWLNTFTNAEISLNSNNQLGDQFVLNELVDDSLLGLGLYSECLSKCCLQTWKYDFISTSNSMSSKEFDRLNRLIENGFKSSSIAIKIATVHGLMYWLESITLGYIGNNNDSKALTDHLCKQIVQIKPENSSQNWRYLSTLWSATFYMIENCLDSIRDAQNFVNLFLKQTYLVLNDAQTPYFFFYQLNIGLERFLLSNMLPSFEISTIQKLFSSKTFFYDEQKTVCLLSLVCTSLYASHQSKSINYWNDFIRQQHARNSAKSSSSNSEANSPLNQENPISKMNEVYDYPQILELGAHPDLQAHLLKVLEVATNFLDRMKLCSTAKEASIYASILPRILADFLPPNDLLNKLITEFLNSSQHPYPEAVAYILFKCFDLLQEKGLQAQIQEWCLLSLSNFLQRTTIEESIWLTSCLLVSASRNLWLKSTFPFLLNRYCSYETCDRAIFYMSVIEFKKQFNRDKPQLQTLYTTFESIAKEGTSYEELFKLLTKDE